MSAEVFDIASTQPPGECWCCGRETPTAELLSLNEHSEVAVCLGCAAFLGRKAQARRDQLDPTAATKLRDLLREGRHIVVEHGWQDLPAVGPVLKRLGRYLP